MKLLERLMLGAARACARRASRPPASIAGSARPSRSREPPQAQRSTCVQRARRELQVGRTLSAPPSVRARTSSSGRAARSRSRHRRARAVALGFPPSMNGERSNARRRAAPLARPPAAGRAAPRRRAGSPTSGAGAAITTGIGNCTARVCATHPGTKTSSKTRRTSSRRAWQIRRMTPTLPLPARTWSRAHRAARSSSARRIVRGYDDSVSCAAPGGPAESTTASARATVRAGASSRAESIETRAARSVPAACSPTSKAQ